MNRKSLVLIFKEEVPHTGPVPSTRTLAMIPKISNEEIEKYYAAASFSIWDQIYKLNSFQGVYEIFQYDIPFS